jgi:rod shape-determining protein MreB
MVGRTPANVVAIRPLRDGVISEFEITQAMLGYFIGKAHQQSIVSHAATKGCNWDSIWATEVEKGLYMMRRWRRCARSVLVEEPRAAALGAGLPVAEVPEI